MSGFGGRRDMAFEERLRALATRVAFDERRAAAVRPGKPVIVLRGRDFSRPREDQLGAWAFVALYGQKREDGLLDVFSPASRLRLVVGRDDLVRACAISPTELGALYGPGDHVYGIAGDGAPERRWEVVVSAGSLVVARPLGEPQGRPYGHRAQRLTPAMGPVRMRLEAKRPVHVAIPVRAAMSSIAGRRRAVHVETREEVSR
jgi:hypothetical protein